MKWDIDYLLTRLNGDDGKERNKYIRNVPNAKSYKVIIQGKEIPLLERAGLEKSVKSHWEIIAFKNKPANRYLNYQIDRLKRVEPKTFFMITNKLTLHSKVWYSVHLNKVLPAWYRNHPIWLAPKLWKKVKHIAKDFRGDVIFYRKYIPKLKDKQTLKEWMEDPIPRWRPLGVPTLEWRVYLSMLNTALTIWLEPKWQKEQHGYFPGKGVLTAWVSILKKIKEDNIYEFDLKQFFPSVPIGAVTNILTEYGMPKKWALYIENINKSQPILTERDETDETATRENEEIQKGILNKGQKWYKEVEIFIAANGKELWQSLVKEDTGGISIYHEYEFIQLQWALLESYSKKSHEAGSIPMNRSLPQGGGISPLLSVQVLRPLFDNNDTIMYADDGIIFGKPRLKSSQYSSYGIEFNKEKSGYVKKEGIWLKELKFCGLVYNGENNTLRSDTHKGKRLQIPNKKIESIINASNWYSSGSALNRGNLWLQALSSRLGGFIQAMKFNGTYDLSTQWDNWEIARTKTSWYNSKTANWMRANYSYRTNLYNSSTLANYWLLNKLSKRTK